MTDSEARFTGGCLCGALRFEVTGAPNWIAHCHCESCRRQSGSVIVPFIGIARTALSFIAGRPRDYASSPGVTRSFCPDCGSSISYRTDKRPDEVDLFIGAVDEPERFAPTFHVHCDEQITWLKVDDGLPRHAGSGSAAYAGD